MNSQLEQQLTQLPSDPGIYKFFDSSGEIIYVGKAVNLKNRVKSYFSDSNITPKTRVLVSNIFRLEYIVVQSEMDALILEANLIKEHKPRYNIILKDDKSHLYIKVTLYEDWPRISTCRATDMSLDPKATYFGPFPSGRIVKDTLRSLRRIFPYIAHNQPPVAGRRRPPQSYFYYNLPLESLSAPVDKKEYRRQIFQLIRFLEGRRQGVTEDLEKEMKMAAKELQFEKAALIKRQLDGMSYITQKSISPDSYVSNPELMAEKREQGLRELRGALASYFPTLENESIQDDYPMLERIECFDISNISGQYAVGSMVVFVNGEPQKSDYRRFRIKKTQAPNDVAMMEEVLARRLKRLSKQAEGIENEEVKGADESFSALPKLIMVDGGKGQLAVVQQVLAKSGLAIPVVGMTKREEELLIQHEADINNESIEPGSSLNLISQPGKPKRSAAHGAIVQREQDDVTKMIYDKNFTTIRLARGSEALFLIQRIRDEAHRFAITYHRKLRAKGFLPKQ